MAERRMFAKTIIDSDSFLEMPLSTQALYFHLSMRADDEGFINNPKKIQRMIGGSEDDLKLLVAKNFIIPFESGIVVIKHWRIHNYIQSDRFKPTMYQDEKALLDMKDNKAYTIKNGMYTECIQNVSEMDTQVRLGKDRLDKDSIEDAKASTPTIITFGEYQKVKLTEEEHQKLIADYGDLKTEKIIKFLDEYIKDKGYKTKSKTHYLAIKRWVVDAVNEKEAKKAPKVNKFVPENQRSYDFDALEKALLGN